MAAKMCGMPPLPFLFHVSVNPGMFHGMFHGMEFSRNVQSNRMNLIRACPTHCHKPSLSKLPCHAQIQVQFYLFAINLYMYIEVGRGERRERERASQGGRQAGTYMTCHCLPLTWREEAGNEMSESGLPPPALTNPQREMEKVGAVPRDETENNDAVPKDEMPCHAACSAMQCLFR